MTASIPFTKMHGCANDFVVIRRDTLPESARAALNTPLDPAWIRDLCDRRTGIGADGVLLLDQNDNGWSATVLNADGHDGGMCGNGLRCIARLLMESDDAQSGEPLIVRMAGRSTVLHIDSASPFRCTLDLGSVIVGRATAEPEPASAASIPTAGVPGEVISLAWAGNPHSIVFMPPGSSRIALTEISREIRTSGSFPSGVNVTLARAVTPNRIEAHTDERGVGPTMACASGAIAAAASAHTLGLTALACTVRMPGGELLVHLRPSGPESSYRATITAGAETVFRGELLLPARRPRA